MRNTEERWALVQRTMRIDPFDSKKIVLDWVEIAGTQTHHPVARDPRDETGQLYEFEPEDTAQTSTFFSLGVPKRVSRVVLESSLFLRDKRPTSTSFSKHDDGALYSWTGQNALVRIDVSAGELTVFRAPGQVQERPEVLARFPYEPAERWRGRSSYVTVAGTDVEHDRLAFVVFHALKGSMEDGHFAIVELWKETDTVRLSCREIPTNEVAWSEDRIAIRRDATAFAFRHPFAHFSPKDSWGSIFQVGRSPRRLPYPKVRRDRECSAQLLSFPVGFLTRDRLLAVFGGRSSVDSPQLAVARLDREPVDWIWVDGEDFLGGQEFTFSQEHSNAFGLARRSTANNPVAYSAKFVRNPCSTSLAVAATVRHVTTALDSLLPYQRSIALAVLNTFGERLGLCENE